MIEILHNEVRELLVEAYEKAGNTKEVAECFEVDTSTVYGLHRQKKAIQEHPNITIEEIIEKLDLHVSNEIVHKVVIKMGDVYKKNFFILINENISNMKKFKLNIVMDKIPSHHVKEVSEIINHSGKHLTLLYLSTYSSDFNLIEMIWSK